MTNLTTEHYLDFQCFYSLNFLINTVHNTTMSIINMTFDFKSILGGEKKTLKKGVPHKKAPHFINSFPLQHLTNISTNNISF